MSMAIFNNKITLKFNMKILEIIINTLCYKEIPRVVRMLANSPFAVARPAKISLS